MPNKDTKALIDLESEAELPKNQTEQYRSADLEESRNWSLYLRPGSGSISPFELERHHLNVGTKECGLRIWAHIQTLSVYAHKRHRELGITPRETHQTAGWSEV